MSRLKVAFLNESTVLTDAEISPIMGALQTQVSSDLMSTWGIDAELVQVPKNGAIPVHHAWLGAFDNSNQAGALGYHDLTPDGLPVGKVFTKTDEEYGALDSVTFSHELLEMLVDPYINTTVLDPVTSNLYAMEVSDAVEADNLGYQINGITVSDFVLPTFFDPTRAGKGEPLSFRGNVHEPFTLAPGGYLSYLSLREIEKGWQMATSPEDSATAGARPAKVNDRYPEGSRRERRTRLGHFLYSVSRQIAT